MEKTVGMHYAFLKVQCTYITHIKVFNGTDGLVSVQLLHAFHLQPYATKIPIMRPSHYQSFSPLANRPCVTLHNGQISIISQFRWLPFPSPHIQLGASKLLLSPVTCLLCSFCCSVGGRSGTLLCGVGGFFCLRRSIFPTTYSTNL